MTARGRARAEVWPCASVISGRHDTRWRRGDEHEGERDRGLLDHRVDRHPALVDLGGVPGRAGAPGRRVGSRASP